MTSNPTEFVLPRPGRKHDAKPPISAPAESAFTATFGAPLPPAKYLQTSNGKTAYYELPPQSTGSASPGPDRVLLIHGVQTPALGLLPLTRALQEAFPATHFVLFDHWGHGLSETPYLPHEPGLFLNLIDALLDKLEWPSAHLIGYSFGGVLTSNYVTSRTSKVKSFTLVAPAGLMRSSDLSAEGQAHLRGGLDETATRKWVQTFLEGGKLVVPADWEKIVGRGEVVAPAIRAWQLREHAGHAASVVGIVRDGGVFDSHATFVEAARTGIPSLAVLGGTDDICSEQDLKDVGITNVAVVPQAGHDVVRSRVSEVAKHISDFWEKVNSV